MDWKLIAFYAVPLLTLLAVFWLGLTVGYRVKLRRASRLCWPERDRSHLWAEELEDDRPIEFAPIAEWPERPRAGLEITVKLHGTANVSAKLSELRQAMADGIPEAEAEPMRQALLVEWLPTFRRVGR